MLGALFFLSLGMMRARDWEPQVGSMVLEILVLSRNHISVQCLRIEDIGVFLLRI